MTLSNPIAYINAIGTACPPHDVHGSFVDYACDRLATDKAQYVFRRMVERAGIEHRYSTLEPGQLANGEIDSGGFYQPGAFPVVNDRMTRYEDEALSLAVAAVRGLSVPLSGITHVIVASCTGFSAPGLDVQLIDALGLSDGVQRTLVGFMGCAAAVPALRIARDAVRADPSAKVLVVNVELCTLHFHETEQMDEVLSFLLFADGASAAVISSEPTGLRMDGFRSRRVANSAGAITWKIASNGFRMHLGGEVPATIAQAMRTAREETSDDGLFQGRKPEEFTHWAVHAGGRTVLDAVERSLGLEPTALAHSRAVLREHGNMSSATVMFALQRIIQSERPGQGMAIAFGPGLVAESFQFARGH